VQWARRFLIFHRDQAGAWRHPREFGAADVVSFLNIITIVHPEAASGAEVISKAT
jgi:hypothetical protein